METKNNAICGYDLTIPAETLDKCFIQEKFEELCKSWVFQLEKGDETGYLHYQCRVSLKTKIRPSQMITLCNKIFGGCQVKPTCSENFINKNFNYVMKDDTRVDGPWSDKDEKPHYIQKRFRGKINWRPWQQQLMDIINLEPDDRSVNIVINLNGNRGKSFLTMYLMTFKKATRIPAQPEMRDTMRMVMDQPKVPCYFIDLPKAIAKNNQNAIYSGIEEIKNGYSYDDRYKYKCEIFEPPHVWVFTNEIPDSNLLSMDRWIIWTIRDDELVKVNNLAEIVD